MSNLTEDKPEKEDAEDIHYKRPDFIVIDDRSKKTSYKGQEIHHESQESPPPKSLRFFCFLGVIFCVIFGIGLLLINLFVTAFMIVTFLQNKELNQTCFSLWKLWKNTLVAGACCLVGLLFPTVGVWLLTFYFSLLKDRSGLDLFRSIINK